ncbi:MAG: RNA polymerase sigma factor SigZ [Flavobacteriales bacterium]|nr:RNA polymerase sigma factor SigZ [Flavobacteriales bacterium]
MTTQAIWGDFRNELLGFIKARVNDTNIAEDILQEVFIKIHLNVKSLQTKDRLASWVYQITRNTIIDYYRKKEPLKNAKQISMTFEKSLAEELNESNNDFSNCLKSHIEELPEKYQDALKKTSFGGISQKEYAQQMHISYSAAKSRIQRARQQLKDLFVACCAVETDGYGNVISSTHEDCDC